MIIVLMGVSGSGKTTIGKVLAKNLDWPFADADDFHPPANIEKMKRGEPLTDADRRPWLEALRDHIDAACEAGRNMIVGCSALKHDYREYLRSDEPDCVRFVYLEGSEELIAERLAKRKGHFMPPGLLRSQFAALEPPQNAIRVDISPSPETIAQNILDALGLQADSKD